jgi:ABC-2 type transport system permease protein
MCLSVASVAPLFSHHPNAGFSLNALDAECFSISALQKAYGGKITVMLRYLYLLRGAPARWIPVFAWVAIDIVLWGFISKYLNSVASSGFNFVPALLGAVLLFDFFTRVMHGVAGVFLEDVWSRNFLNLFASPVTIPQYLLGLVATSTITSFISLIVMLVLATAAFGLSFFVYGLALVPFLMILFLFGVSLGVCASAAVLQLGPSAEWLVWPVPAIISPFAGVFYPVSILPHWMQFVGKLLPVSYVFEGLRKIISGGTVPETSLILGGGLAVVYVFLACWFFKRVFRHAGRTGILARYSAETVS